jgi:hypothetical protein
MAEHEIDAIGAEAAAVMKTMLQLATLVALRTRERGQKDAEGQVKLTQARLKEAREMAARQVRLAKAQDPRNAELQRMIERQGVVLRKDRADLERAREELSRERAELGRVAGRAERAEAREFAAETMTFAEASALAVAERDDPVLAYDSVERREALALYLADMGVEPELIEVRMMAELAQAKPSVEAAREPIRDAIPMPSDPTREIGGRELGRDR